MSTRLSAELLAFYKRSHLLDTYIHDKFFYNI